MKSQSLVSRLVLTALVLLATPALAQRADPDSQKPKEARGGQRGTARPRDSKPAPPPGARTPHPGTARPEGQGRPNVAVPRERSVRPEPRQAYRAPRIDGRVRPRMTIPIIVYPQPYFVFRPRVQIGFGIYIGVPIPYPIWYGRPHYVFGDAEPGYGRTAPGQVILAPPHSYGGISFEIVPDDAAVSVDGVWVGLARDFSPTRQPLTLTPGRHHIELEINDATPIGFEVDVRAGDVIPYRGILQPQ